jgi:hypothetical protein
MYDLATLTLAHEEHLYDVMAGYGGHIEIGVIRAYWSLQSLGEIRWLVSTATARRRRSQQVAVLNSLSAVPPHHAGVNVDDEPPARRVAWVAADRPWVGHAGTGCEPVVRLARDRPHRARRGAVTNEEGRFMRMADKSERSQGAARQDSGGRRLSEEPEQGGWRGEPCQQSMP